MLRVGELTKSSNANGNHTITIDSIEINNEYLEIALNTSKAD